MILTYEYITFKCSIFTMKSITQVPGFSILAQSTPQFPSQTFKFFEEAIEQLEPESGVEKEYYLTNETAFVWRSLRLLARQSVPYFQHIQNTKNLTLTDNLQNIITLIGKEYKKENGMEVTS